MAELLGHTAYSFRSRFTQWDRCESIGRSARNPSEYKLRADSDLAQTSLAIVPVVNVPMVTIMVVVAVRSYDDHSNPHPHVSHRRLRLPKRQG